MKRNVFIILFALFVIILIALMSWKFYFDNAIKYDSDRIICELSHHGVLQEPDGTIKYLIEMFRAETDTMIYKATVWVGVWMTVFAAVLILPTLYQLHEQKEGREEVKQSIREMERKNLELSERADSKISELDCAIEEIRISHIMACISNIPDPILVRQNESMSLAKSYLMMLYKESVRFENIVERMHYDYKQGRNKRIEEEISYIHLVIIEILTSISKSQIIFHDADLNLEFFEAIRVAHRQYKHICNNHLDIDSVKDSLHVINSHFSKLIGQMELVKVRD